MKKLWLILIVGIFMVGVVSAATCDDSQTIMRLYQESNSHVSFWNEDVADYTEEICYDVIFGSTYAGANPHDCTGTGAIPDNKILGLNDITNAHAEEPSLDNYNIDVCYGDLSCVMRDGGCNDGEEMVLSLYQDTNSHITDPNYVPGGIVSEWKFDGDVLDSSGSGNDGVNNGASFVDGKIGNALEFDGVDDYVEVLDNGNLEPTEITISMWVYPTTWTHSTHVALITKRSAMDNGFMFFQLSNGNLNVDFGGGGVSSINRWDTGYLPPINQWTQVIYTYDGAGGTLYVNGDYESSTSKGVGSNVASPGNLRIGSDSSGVRYLFKGSIDEVAIYDKALTSEEVQHLYNQGVYEKKICCVAPATFWADMDGNPIAEADLGDRVKLIQTNTVAPGYFEIKEGDEGWFNGDDDIRVGLNNISGVDDSGDLVGIWEITPEDLEKTGDYDNFYFKVNDVDESEDPLVISDEYSDDPMVVTLESPSCGEAFEVGKKVTVSITATDPDDLITGNVTVDGDVYFFSNGGLSFEHTLENSGNIQVELYAENSRGYRRRVITSVMVVELGVARDYVAACIDKPADFSDITSSNVAFDASNSKGLRCVNPTGLSVGEGCTPVLKEGLWFSWRFSDGLINFNHDGGATNPDGSPYKLAYEFHKNFATAGHNWAILDVEMM